MDIHLALGIASAVIALSAIIPYIISIVENKTEPHPISWCLWAVIGLVTLVTYWATGARDTIWLAVVNLVGPLTIAILSFKYWDGKIKRFDYVCLGISVTALLVWIFSGKASWGLTLNIVADCFAALPTIIKTYQNPESEDLKAWSIYLTAYLLGIAAAGKWVYGIIIFPLYLTVLALVMIILISRKFFKTKTSV